MKLIIFKLQQVISLNDLALPIYVRCFTANYVYSKIEIFLPELPSFRMSRVKINACGTPDILNDFSCLSIKG